MAGFETQAIRGVTQHFGPRKTDGRYGGQYITEGSIKEEVIRIRYNELPDGTSPKSPIIPAHATILDARFKVKTAFGGGTSYKIGTYNASTGAAVSDNSIFTTANLALANIDADGDVVAGSGAGIGVGVGAAAVRLGIVAAGTFTAGYAEIIVRYVEAPPSPKL